MDPDSKASACLAVLADGPATTAEIAAETGFSKHLACSHLFNLLARNKVEHTPYFKPGQPKRFWLWSIKGGPLAEKAADLLAGTGWLPPTLTLTL